MISQNNEMNNLSKNLKVFEPYIGKTYEGEFAESTPEKPVFDVQYWERILNGNGIKITHSVNDGEYGGESIIMWDLKSESLQSWYFTTAGFYTEATVTFEDKKVVSIEKVTGNQNGITNHCRRRALTAAPLRIPANQYRWFDGLGKRRTSKKTCKNCILKELRFLRKLSIF